MVSSCATYYQKNYDLMQAIYNGNLDNAEQMLTDKKWQKPNRNILLYYLNKNYQTLTFYKIDTNSQSHKTFDFFFSDFGC
jgi:hypothetical protein